MALDKDLQQLFGDVRSFLHSLHPSTILPPHVEAERLRLLLRMQCFASSRPELQLGGPWDAAPTEGDVEEEEEDEELLQEKDAGTTEEVVSSEGRPGPPGLVHTAGGRVKRSSSLSSRSSSGSNSYTSNSYTSTSYTSNGYSSFEGGGGVASKPVQEDIYEEFDAVHMRIAAITPVSSSTTDTSVTPTSGTTTTTPFFSSLRNSLTYSRKDKRDSLHRDSGKDSASKDKSKDSNKKQDTSKNNKKNEKISKKEKKSKNKRDSICNGNSENKENLIEEETSECDVTDGSMNITAGSNADCLKEAVSIDGSDAGLGDINKSADETPVIHDIEEQDDEEEVENSYMEGLQTVAFSSAIARCARHGVLHKKSKALLRSWRPFQAVVAPGVLLLYAKETDQRQRKGLELGLYDVRVATAEAEPQPDRRDLVYFELVAPARKTHTFMTRTMSDRDEWIQAVGQYTRNRNSLPVLGAVASPSGGSTAATTVMPASLRGSVATKLNAHLVPSPLTFAERAEGGVGDDETLSTTGSQEEEEDTFSSDEVYEEVNIEDIRSASGPSLTEMLEPHLFPNNDLSTYYTVPDEDDTGSISNLSTSTPKKPPQDGVSSSPSTPAKGGKHPPARPPPPTFPTEKLVKNHSALHQTMVISPRTALINAFKAPAKFSLSSSIAAVKESSPIACKKLSFSGSSLRPLPATPIKPADDGEIYCEIDEEDDYYEESEVDGVSLMTGTSQEVVGRKLYSVKDRPPPLPSRGPPPIPNLEQLLSKNRTVPAFDPDLFEDYDIPGDVDMQLLSHKITNVDQESDTLAPLPQDLSLVLPTFPLSPNTIPAKKPPIPEKGSGSNNADSDEDNLYKVPSSAPINDDIYQVPKPNPVPVNNNNITLRQEKGASTPVGGGAPELPISSPPSKPSQPKSEQSPTSKRSPVFSNSTSGLSCNNNQSNNTLTSILSNGLVNRSSPIKRDNSLVNEKYKNTLNNPSDPDDNQCTKTLQSKTSPAPLIGSPLKTGSVPGSECLSVKARIALLNQNEVEAPSPASPSKTSDDFVIMIDNKEIRLDQAKKRAFLESTLNMSEPGQANGVQKTSLKSRDK